MKWLGIILTFTGAALVLHILFHLSLRIGVLTAIFIIFLSLISCFIYLNTSEKIYFKRKIITGIWAGLGSLIVYDVSKALLAVLDPSPFNPFEALKHFGVLLLGENATSFSIMAVGTSFHLLNGFCFAMAYVFLFPKNRVWKGVLWGCFLELFQLTLYPDWLNIKFKSEFMMISSLAHILYGLTISLIVRWRSRWQPKKLELL